MSSWLDMTFSIDLLIKRIIREDINYEIIVPSQKLEYPCSICSKRVLDNQESIECNTCHLWTHIKCDGTSVGEYHKLMEEYANALETEEESTTPWHCLKCRISDNHDKFPFTLCDEVLLRNITNSDSMRMFEALPSFEVVSKVSKFSNLAKNDVDENLPTNIWGG